MNKLGLSIFVILTGTTLLGCSSGSNSITAESTGKEVFQATCSSCHSGGFKGWMTEAPAVGDHVVWQPLIKKGIDAMTLYSINGVNKMPAKGGCHQCTDEQIRSAIEYMVSISQ